MTNNPNKGKGRAITWMRAHVDHPGGACLIWPMSRDRDGYGMFGFEGKRHKAHRWMCEAIHGPAPTPQHHAAHSCGAGHLGCVHPHHLSWKTPKQNADDMVKHGRARFGRQPRLKITDEQVAQIRALKGAKPHPEIAKMFGITDSHVRKIHQGITRGDPSERKHHWFTPEENAAVRQMLADRVSYKDMAARLGVSVGSISSKIRRIRYPDEHLRRAA